MLKGIVLKYAAASLIMFTATSLQAQESTTTSKETCEKKCTESKGNKKHAFMDSLSEEQKATFTSLEKIKKDKKSAFEATFSPEQLAITKNEKLDRKQKHESLRATFTDAQKEQIKANREEGKVAKEAFVASLSEEQKALMPKRHRGKGKRGDKKGHHERKG